MLLYEVEHVLYWGKHLRLRGEADKFYAKVNERTLFEQNHVLHLQFMLQDNDYDSEACPPSIRVLKATRIDTHEIRLHFTEDQKRLVEDVMNEDRIIMPSLPAVDLDMMFNVEPHYIVSEQNLWGFWSQIEIESMLSVSDRQQSLQTLEDARALMHGAPMVFVALEATWWEMDESGRTDRCNVLDMAYTLWDASRIGPPLTTSHFIIAENAHLRNGVIQPDRVFYFAFGQSQIGSMGFAQQNILHAISDHTNRVVIISHDVVPDLGLFGLTMRDQERYRIFDVRKLYQTMKGNPHTPSELSDMLSEYGFHPDETHLGNSGEAGRKASR